VSSEVITHEENDMNNNNLDDVGDAGGIDDDDDVDLVGQDPKEASGSFEDEIVEVGSSVELQKRDEKSM